MSGQTFVMLFDDDATPMLEAVMAHGMSMRFPELKFRSDRSPNARMDNTVIPILGAVDLDVCDDVLMTKLPPGLRQQVSEAFSDLLREARAAKPS